MSATTGHRETSRQGADVATLHTLTEEFAAFLSEVSVGDLACPAPDGSGDLGDLCLRINHQNLQVAAALIGRAVSHGERHTAKDRAALSHGADPHGGCGLEVGYRQTASLMERGFASPADGTTFYELESLAVAVDLMTLYDIQISRTVVHTWDIAQALGLPYRPSPGIAQRVLRASVLSAPHLLHGGATPAVDADAFLCALTLLGRRPSRP